MTDLYTLTLKEVKRFLRVWKQTLVPPAITITLYLLVFGKFVGTRISDIEGFSYIDFIFPGLLMMSVIMASYSNTSSSFFASKFQKHIEELYISSISPLKILIGYCLGAILRGLLVGLIVFTVGSLLTDITIYSLPYAIIFILLSSSLFAIIGLINALYANSFDDISIIPTFLITPLIYLGGVFYSIDTLPPFWQQVTVFNPIYYMINGLRYSFLGYSEVPVVGSMVILAIIVVIVAFIAYYLIKKGTGVRS